VSEDEELDHFGKIAENLIKDIDILIAEDNIVNQKVIKGYFNKLGFNKIQIVENGKEVLEILEKKHFDIIFMDIQMPIMDGLTATMQIRKNEKITQKHIPIIALTAHSFIDEKQRCFDVGVDDYLGKPIQIDRLIIALEKWTGSIVGSGISEANEIELVNANANAMTVSSEISQEQVEIDMQFFNQTKQAFGAAFADVAQAYIKDAIEKIHLIEQAILNNDIETIRANAHQLKSSSGSLGIRRVVDISKMLEELVKSSEYNKNKAEAILNQIISEVEKAKLFLGKNA
jgi:CheY-like chemotaxis protein